MAHANTLSSVPLFGGLSKAELRSVAAHLKEEWFNAGEDIVEADDKGGRLYIITEGRARIIVNGKARRSVGPGDYFGEMSLIDDSPRAATVRAETTVHTVWLGRTNFLSLLQESWPITRKVLGDLCARIRAADKSPTA
jgi:CRP/FNR family transcriptional regulator, cyclic AMP receptor protein